MIHAGDLVKIKGQHPAEGTFTVVIVKGDVATLRHTGGAAHFNEYTCNLYRIACGH